MKKSVISCGKPGENEDHGTRYTSEGIADYNKYTGEYEIIKVEPDDTSNALNYSDNTDISSSNGTKPQKTTDRER